MPKLSKAVIKEKKGTIEDAARELFIKQGFHATSMRDISRTAEVSLGNLYNYYATKEAIFESIINGYLTEIDEKLRGFSSRLTNRSSRQVCEIWEKWSAISSISIPTFGF